MVNLDSHDNILFIQTYLRADPTSSYFLQPDEQSFWGEMRE
jgi:hypothetical protein